ncbi:MULTISPECIES: YeeE/YedE family protein [unclassified Microcoleus]|uniref:YeeE/YedE family protein n=1 Tax=unclassified Microcoleus TaxID=2642155 RepID=UPI002FD5B22F
MSSSISGEPFLAPFRSHRLIIAIALALFTVGAITLNRYGWQQSLLFLIGGLLGLTLYHSSFGFASAYRKLLVHRDARGAIAQIIMLAIATVLFAPTLAAGTVFGQQVRGAVSPVGVQGAIGAFLFGIGMQLGGACGCGTLYTLGSGSLTLLVTLVTFCIGAFGASLTRQLWVNLPALPAISLADNLGWFWAVVLQLTIFAALFVTLQRIFPSAKALSSPGLTSSPPLFPSSLTQLIYGPWSLPTGAIALSLLNWLTLIVSGQPWRITWGFALWAAEIASFLGWDSTSSPFWKTANAQAALANGVFADASSVMNGGIVLGSLLAAGLAGRWVPTFGPSKQILAAAILGGLLMGYSAFLAYGCNVSGFFGAIASTSLHGWLWIVAALLGTAIGVRLRPLFRLPN